jgi:hypothetical protein
MDIVTIPGQLVPHVREGALYLLGLAADEAGKETDRKKPALEAPLRRFDEVRALLEALPFEVNTRARIDGGRGPLVLEALTEDTKVTRGIAETARSEGHTELADEYFSDLPAMERFTASLSGAGA